MLPATLGGLLDVSGENVDVGRTSSFARKLVDAFQL
jgi:hypothetical protein